MNNLDAPLVHHFHKRWESHFVFYIIQQWQSFCSPQRVAIVTRCFVLLGGGIRFVGQVREKGLWVDHLIQGLLFGGLDQKSWWQLYVNWISWWLMQSNAIWLIIMSKLCLIWYICSMNMRYYQIWNWIAVWFYCFFCWLLPRKPSVF